MAMSEWRPHWDDDLISAVRIAKRNERKHR